MSGKVRKTANTADTKSFLLDKASLDKSEILTPRRGSISASQKVVRLLATGSSIVSSNIVVKLGPDVEMTEAENMKFVREQTSIPVPRVLNACEKEGIGYIIMEYVEGEMLRKAWPRLAREEKDTVLSELRDYMCQLRRIKPFAAMKTTTTPPTTTPPTTPLAPTPAGEGEGEGEKVNDNPRIQSVTGGPVVDQRVMGAVKGGPFASEADFNTWQLEQLHSDIDPFNRDIYTAMHKTDHRIVFSHGDYGFHNVLVCDGHVAAVIDWESSGWFPEHWDYCKAAGHFSYNADLYDALKRIFEKHYFAEFLMDMWFTKEVKHGGF